MDWCVVSYRLKGAECCQPLLCNQHVVPTTQSGKGQNDSDSSCLNISCIPIYLNTQYKISGIKYNNNNNNNINTKPNKNVFIYCETLNKTLKSVNVTMGNR